MKINATYWVHFKISPRVGDFNVYQICDEDGLVNQFKSYEKAIAWCESSGESYYDNTERA